MLNLLTDDAWADIGIEMGCDTLIGSNVAVAGFASGSSLCPLLLSTFFIFVLLQTVAIGAILLVFLDFWCTSSMVVLFLRYFIDNEAVVFVLVEQEISNYSSTKDFFLRLWQLVAPLALKIYYQQTAACFLQQVISSDFTAIKVKNDLTRISNSIYCLFRQNTRVVTISQNYYSQLCWESYENSKIVRVW